MVRALVTAWAAWLGYYVLRVTVWAFPESCPDTLREPTEDPRCDWNVADAMWLISLPILALATLVVLITLGARRIKLARRR